MTYVDKALEIAKKAHRLQVDKSGIDYILHPMKVASLVNTDEERAVAYLHDVIEDTDITSNDLLREGIPVNIVEAVVVLTKNKAYTYKQYLERVKKNELAKVVKIADLQHNSDISRLKNITQKDLDRLEKYQQAIKFLTGT